MEMAQNGVLIINSHNMSFAHKKPEIDRIRSAYEATTAVIKDALDKGDIDERIGGSIVTAAPLRATA